MHLCKYFLRGFASRRNTKKSNKKNKKKAVLPKLTGNKLYFLIIVSTRVD